MEISQHIEVLGEQGRLLARSASAAGPDADVPSCPGWVVRDLVRHQGGVHRWATGIVATPRSEPWDAELDEIVGSWPADADLLEWFADGHARLISALSTADPDLDCWTFLPGPSPLAMWARRQAHETAVHRVDADLAAGGKVEAFDPEFAADGIDELLSCFITRGGDSLRADPPKSLRVRCDDATGDWLVRIGPDRVVTEQAVTGQSTNAFEAADCLVSGSAADVYLALWNRRSTEGLSVRRDASMLDLFLDKVHVRWS